MHRRTTLLQPGGLDHILAYLHIRLSPPGLAVEGDQVGARTVLLVDGDRDSRAVYRIVLEHAGFAVLEAADGDTALRLAGAQPVDVVVMELTLRRMGGHAFLERIRQLEHLKRTCVLVVTARGLQEDRARAEQAGCTRFLVKPLEPQQLLRQVRDTLRERSGDG